MSDNNDTAKHEYINAEINVTVQIIVQFINFMLHFMLVLFKFVLFNWPHQRHLIPHPR